MERKKILVVEDDRQINRLLCDFLSEQGYGVIPAYDGREAMNLFRATEEVHLVLLDIMLPFQSGDSVLEKIREVSDVPVIMISAKDTVRTKIDLMRMGADDYITKPFDLDEVLVRIEAVLRRYSVRNKAEADRTAREDKIVVFKNLCLDTEQKTVYVKETPLVLTSKEYGILDLMMRNPKKLFSKANLFESVWNEVYYSEDNTLKVHMSNLRNKIKEYDTEEYIETVWGMGYKLKS